MNLRRHRRPLAAGLLAVSVLPALFSGAAEVPPSTRPPGNLEPTNTPQIVLLTFDDSVTTASLALVRQVLDGHHNPNGHTIKATFFVNFSALYAPAAMRQLYDEGHEIALHTMSHGTSSNSSLERWRQEIAGERRTLSELCGIPAEEVVGFRAPGLMPNDNAFRVLFERQLRYDTSFREYLEGYSTATTNMLWPYTLNQGLAQVTEPGFAPATNYPGFFEIPLWAQFTNMEAVILMDPPETFSTSEVVEIWKTNFLAHYHGNRAPYGLFLHASSTGQWLSNPDYVDERVQALRGFIGWALAQPDTWFISCRDLVDYMLAPVPAAAAASSQPFLTPARTPYPTASISRCTYPGLHTISVCGPCPPAAPNYTNAYLGLTPMTGGAVALNVASQNTTYAWCVMTVSNNVPQRIYDWSVFFALTGGTVQSLYDTTWTQTLGVVSADARQYNMQIAPGAVRVFTFRVLRSGGAVTFSDASVAASGLGPLPIRLDLRQQTSPAGWRLSWDDHALLYRVECATNLLAPQVWEAVTNDLCQPALTEPHAADGAPRFYRVQGTLY